MDHKTIAVSKNELADAVKAIYTDDPLAPTQLFMEVEDKLRELQTENEELKASMQKLLQEEITRTTKDICGMVRPSDNITEVERANINSLFIAFGNSVTEVEVEYRGSGDCGGIEDVNVNGALDSDIKVNLIRQYHDHDEVVTLCVEDAVRSVADYLIDRRHSGFEINEGGGGTITFNAVEKTVQIDHYDNIVEERYDHETLIL